jgi:glycine cleavage system aminomethyltransferase T/glycine/D-amino acid oxidase-like deaminating enzyme
MTPPSHARAVIIGGGIAGCSTAYHLTKLGWKDVVLLEQGQLSCGTTWHAAGLVGQLRAHESLTRLVRYGTRLYAQLEAETGLATGWKQCGSVVVARTPDRVTQLKRNAAVARAQDVPCEMISPAEAGKLWPPMRVDDLAGAVWLPSDGKANPTDLTQSLAKGARNRGARIAEGTRVLSIGSKDGRVTGVNWKNKAGEEGHIDCEVVVNCAGQWGRNVGRMAGVSVPLHSAEHYYIVTKEIAGVHRDLPVMRDPDGYIYFKEEVGGLVMGGFEPNAKPWGMDGIPDDFEFQLLPDDWDQFQILMENALHRVPALETTEIRKFYNGPESFTPDNNFLLGEAPELRGFFVGCGFNSIGIASSGGAGMALAEWIVAGEPTMDLWPVDIRRFARFHTNERWLHDRVKEVLGLHYMMPWPNRELESARPLRRSPLYAALAEKGAVFGSKMGWERANFFVDAVTPAKAGAQFFVTPVKAGAQFFVTPVKTGAQSLAPRLRGDDKNERGDDKNERGDDKNERGDDKGLDYTWSKPRWLAHSGAEHRACRDAVALFDMSSFSKLIVKGRDAEAVLQSLVANDVAVPVGRTVYTGMLNERGGYESDFTLTRTGLDEFLLVTGSAQATRDASYLERLIPESARCSVVDVTGQYAVLALMGPRARELLSRISKADFSNDAFSFGASQVIDVGYATCRATRLTYVGELGWELYVPVEMALTVYEALGATGRELGLVDAGYYAIDSLRVEKGYRAWGRELSPDVNPVEAGLAFAVKLAKPIDFRGRAAVEKAKAHGARRRIVSLVASDPQAMLWGGELMLRDGRPVGQLSSAAYGHSVGAPVALGMATNADGLADARFVESGHWEIDVAGVLVAARASLAAPWDPASKRVRC